MTPEEDQNLQAHVEAIAAILYQNTDPLKLKTLEEIEQSVRQQILKHISPQIGVFLFSKQQGQ
jgi:chromosome segregation and condensation protein ScpB